MIGPKMAVIAYVNLMHKHNGNKDVPEIVNFINKYKDDPKELRRFKVFDKIWQLKRELLSS